VQFLEFWGWSSLARSPSQRGEDGHRTANIGARIGCKFNMVIGREDGSGCWRDYCRDLEALGCSC
jgi:hypothetical protein